MANGIKYQAHELLNKVLNAGEDALKVDIDNVTLTTEGGDVAIDVALDKANDSVTIYANTAADGTGTSTVPLVDAAGNLQIDIVSSALPSGGATATNQTTMITALQLLDNAVDGNYLDTNLNLAGTDAPTGGGTEAGVLRVTIANNSTGVVSIDDNAGSLTVDGTVTANLSATDNAVLDAMVVDLAALETLQTSTNTKLDTLETTLTAIETDQAALEVLSTAANVDHAQIELATEASQAALEKMLYGTALAVTAVSGGSDHTLGATYEAFYVGVGGDVSLDLATGGANIVFKNLASGQLLPVRATVVNATGTTATNIVALKA